MLRVSKWVPWPDVLLIVIAVGSLPISRCRDPKAPHVEALRSPYTHSPYFARECDFEGCSLGTVKYDNGAKYQGQLRNGKPHGYGTHSWPNGDRYIGDWIDDQRNGHGTYSWPNGDRYAGAWTDSKKTGHGTYTWRDGRKYVGQWQGDKKHGIGNLIWTPDHQYVGEWSDDTMHGRGADIKPGSIFTLWAESRQEGIWVHNVFTKSDEQEAVEAEQAAVAAFQKNHQIWRARLKSGCDEWLMLWQEDFGALVQLAHSHKYSVSTHLPHAFSVGQQLRAFNTLLRDHLLKPSVQQYCDAKVVKTVDAAQKEWDESVELGVHLIGPVFLDPFSPVIWFKSANFTLLGSILTGMLTLLTGVFVMMSSAASTRAAADELLARELQDELDQRSSG